MKNTMDNIYSQAMHDPVLYRCLKCWQHNPEMSKEDFLIGTVLILSEHLNQTKSEFINFAKQAGFNDTAIIARERTGNESEMIKQEQEPKIDHLA